jgi:hypothetical protein
MSKQQTKANLKYRNNKDTYFEQYKFEFYKKDSDLIEKFKQVQGKTKNDKLRNLINNYFGKH